MYRIDRKLPVLVTGATGYVAGWLVKRLLESGVTVHAAVRDPSDQEKLRYLNQIAKSAPGTIRYFQTDLLDEGSYAQAMEGCSIVFHTASPFRLQVSDPQRELLEPAIQGTRNVLMQANATSSVRRVVLTSSCAAIYGDNADLTQIEHGIATEAIWNQSSSLSHNPYSFSKTEAEKEAWRIAEQQQQWTLVVINPSLVMGPGIHPYATSESFHIIRQMGDGTMKAGIPDWGVGVVDVRDVAEAHLSAAYTTHARGRYLISGYNTSFPEMARQLLPKYGSQYPIPKRVLPKFLVWLFGPMVNSATTRKNIALNVGYGWKGDNTKSIGELGLKYRPLSVTMNDFFQQMIEARLLHR
ncbi:NAD-dependent epimerase/dehydratase family protein [Vibrio mangrovi]|uniref:NAD-dependent epimerase/dehydratase family protein n=1 Tax=Vibrio mangrovi TaxID=474394 RepID=A0A1Y6IPX3_9VIBR|nr:NAD-dependent epimerase/dehydratase family protein [Vibrio mangrovi]MDW6004081.1 NAD-dependent epimerase/dehydratase family protein [Vibrio mangrovi]SMR99121.1 short chain dehydrogenase [Vibrio mangrovi]